MAASGGGSGGGAKPAAATASATAATPVLVPIASAAGGSGGSGGSAAAAAPALAASLGSSNTAVTPPTGELEIFFLDVGQGNGTLVLGPHGEKILIDLGCLSGRYVDASDTERRSRDVIEPSVAAFLDLKTQRHLDLLLISHADADHVNLVPEVLKLYRIDRILVGGRASEYAAKIPRRAVEEINGGRPYSESPTATHGMLIPPRPHPSGARAPMMEVRIVAVNAPVASAADIRRLWNSPLTTADQRDIATELAAMTSASSGGSAAAAAAAPAPAAPPPAATAISPSPLSVLSSLPSAGGTSGSGGSGGAPASFLSPAHVTAPPPTLSSVLAFASAPWASAPHLEDRKEASGVGTVRNTNSMVISIRYADVQVIISADATFSTDHYISTTAWARGGALSSFALSGGHHGSRKSFSPWFLNAVDPEWVHFGAEFRDGFAHPEWSLVQRILTHCANIGSDYGPHGIVLGTRDVAAGSDATQRLGNFTATLPLILQMAADAQRTGRPAGVPPIRYAAARYVMEMIGRSVATVDTWIDPAAEEARAFLYARLQRWTRERHAEMMAKLLTAATPGVSGPTPMMMSASAGSSPSFGAGSAAAAAAAAAAPAAPAPASSGGSGGSGGASTALASAAVPTGAGRIFDMPDVPVGLPNDAMLDWLNAPADDRMALNWFTEALDRLTRDFHAIIGMRPTGAARAYWEWMVTDLNIYTTMESNEMGVYWALRIDDEGYIDTDRL